MRNIKVYDLESSPNGYGYIMDKKNFRVAVFRCFSTESNEEDGTYTVGIVEFDNGTIESIPLWRLRFIQ